MNGYYSGIVTCAYCGEVDRYGSCPVHKSDCLTIDIRQSTDRISFFANKNCKCGHWGWKHSSIEFNRHKTTYRGEWGCQIKDCPCEISWQEIGNVQSETKKICECGASATGIPNHTELHSHFNRPNDPSKWCPARLGYKAQ